MVVVGVKQREIYAARTAVVKEKKKKTMPNRRGVCASSTPKGCMQQLFNQEKRGWLKGNVCHSGSKKRY